MRHPPLRPLALLVCLAAAVPSVAFAQPQRGSRVGFGLDAGNPAGAESLMESLIGGGGDGGSAAPPAPANPSAPAEAPPTSPPADAPVLEDGERVLEVRVEGNRRVESEAVRRALVTKAGELFDDKKSAADLRAIWAMGYFADVQLLVQRLPRGVAYVVRVEERPAIREIRLSGNDELSKEDLKEQIDLKPFSILDADAIRRTQKKIQEKYVEKGFFLAEVNHRLDKVPESNEVDVVFVIRENSKVEVKEIRFIGNEKVPEKDLEAVMQTKEGGLLSFLTGEGTYREEIFQRDQAFIQGVYYDRGFLNLKIDKPVVSISPDKRFIYITLKIEEGEQFSIGKLDFSGDLLKSKELMTGMMSSSEGDLFSRTKIGGDINKITDLYYDEGYAYANVTPVSSVNAEAKTIDLTFDIQKGRQVQIERIEIVGNTKTRDKVIRRELRVYEGDLFSGTGMRESKMKVTQLGFFETVEVTHRPGSDDTKVIVQVEVKEKATGTFQVGLGFSNVENFVFTAQISQQNFLGWGQSVSASAQLSSLRSLVQLSVFDPHFLDSNFIASADFFRNQADYLGFVRDATGGDLNVGYYLTADRNVTANATYTLEHVNVEPGRNFDTEIPLANRFRSGVTSSMRFSLAYDSRDNRLFPTDGFLHFGSAEFAPPQLGGSFLFSRYTAYSRFYHPLPLGLVFKTNATFGYIQQLDAKSPLPISELYFLGGINTVRGYLLRSLSPSILVGSSARPDSGVTPFAVGGNKQAIFNFELEFPIFEKVGIRGVVFYDAGNAYSEDEMFFTDKQDNVPLGLFHAFGFGVRWFSPIGPLRFEWGVPLNRRPDDQPLLFEFTIGNSF